MGRRSNRRNGAAVATGIAYFFACALTIKLTRFEGGVAFMWIANGLLTARLTTLMPRNWAAPLAACFVASVLATATLGLGAALAVPLGVVNVGESALGAALLHRYVGRHSGLDSHRWLIIFVLATGIAAPAAGAIVAGASISALSDHSFVTAALQWYNGHALGTLAFMPIFMLIMRGEAWRLIRRMRRAKLIELATLMALVTLVAIATFWQTRFPLLFLPLLPIVLATFRGGALSTAASIVIVAIIGAVLTTRGYGPIALMDGSIGERMQFFQLYLACAMLTVLPANAELQRRSELFRQLRDSEARYRLVTDSSTDIILNVDRNGRLRFVSSSVHQLAGQRAEMLIGRPLTELVHPDDADRAMATLRSVLDDPTAVAVNEYRGRTVAGDIRWFESQSRAVIDDEGNVTGLVSAIREVTRRRQHEQRLAEAALTDPLTGLVNRRGIEHELTRLLGNTDGGCVALFDLDHFKRVNDTYGHFAGDEVLRRFAVVARSSLRDQDLIGRLGGEEFAVLLPDATIEQARLVCDRLRQAIAEARIRVGDAQIGVTVSGGVVTYLRNEAFEDVLHAADVALYRAKHAGRDQLALAA